MRTLIRDLSEGGVTTRMGHPEWDRIHLSTPGYVTIARVNADGTATRLGPDGDPILSDDHTLPWDEAAERMVRMITEKTTGKALEHAPWWH